MALPQQKFREIVFQALYSLELGGSDKDEIISLLMKELQVTKKTVREAFDQVQKIVACKGEIDALIAKTSTSYAFERIQTVEKNILRLSCYELLHDPEVPPKVVIAEGLRLARKFGTPESANFVNALLDAIYKERSGEPKNLEEIKILAETLQKNEDLIQEKMENLLNAEKQLEKSIPLSDLTTIGIGGPTQYYVEIHSVEECRAAIQECATSGIRFFVLGKGSNCLFSDHGFEGVLFHIKIDSYDTPEPGVFKVGAGFSFSLLGTRTARDGWGGLEFATGIPASVGGAVFMNAGANGQQTCDVLEEVEFLHPNGTIERFNKENLTFSYRTSPFQKMPGVILSATFRLQPCAEARTRQQELFQYRKKTQPYHEKSAGCVFVNPPEGSVSAGAMIDKMGLKGCAVGGAAVSEMHANFLVNKEGASSVEMISLIERVEEQVKQKTGITLSREIRIISSLGEIHEK